MKIGILGSGLVGQAVGARLVSLGHAVVLGTRDPGNLDRKQGKSGSLAAWLVRVEQGARVGTFAEAAAHGEILINATNGVSSLQALSPLDADLLEGKILVDIANELDFSHGLPPVSLATDREGSSVGERIQQIFPGVRVVKALNTVGADVMVTPWQLAGGDHTVFICGNDDTAKAVVADLLRGIGWTDIFDLGDISAAHSMEMLVPLWIRARGRLKNAPINFKLVRE